MIGLFELGVNSSFGRGLGWNAADRTMPWVYFFTQFLEDGLHCDCIPFFFFTFLYIANLLCFLWQGVLRCGMLRVSSVLIYRSFSHGDLLHLSTNLFLCLWNLNLRMRILLRRGFLKLKSCAKAGI